MTKRALALTALVVLAFAPPANAADFVVTVTHDDGNGVCTDDPTNCTLRDAVTQAGPLDTVRLPAETYELVQGALELTGDTIVGAGARTTTIEGDGDDRVIYATLGNNQLSGVTITGGGMGEEFTGVGSGVFVRRLDPPVSLTLVETTVRGNEARQGGGVANFGAVLTVLRSTVTDNNASAPTSGAQGAGIFSAGTTTVTNSTVSGNEARSGESFSEGGGVYAAGGTFVAENTTIAANVATFGSAIFVSAQTPAVTLSHTIVASGGAPFACTGGPYQGSHNVVDESSCGGPTANPQLAPLADNGGPTDTHSIAAGSPAVNAGVSCPSTDQRGVARVGACDIGAYESGVTQQPAPPQGGGGNQPPPVDPLPAPVAGKSVNVEPSGTVKVKLPGSKRFVAITEGEQLPVGTIVDVLKGRVTLTAAGGQTATFYAGIFKIGQGKGARPLTTLTLVEKLSCPKAGRAMAAAKKKKRRLWGDGSGRFRTKGKHSAATVVGTKWLVEDRCKSTLTRVTKGRVSVRDFVKKKTVTVRAGKKYLARARR